MNFTLRFSGGQRADFGNHDFEGILMTALERFSPRLKQVYLYMEDMNGPRGGIDKQCRCVLHLRRLPPIVIQDQDENMHALIHRVANRAAYTLSQYVDRKTSRPQRKRRREAQAASGGGSDPSTTTAYSPNSHSS